MEQIDIPESMHRHVITEAYSVRDRVVRKYATALLNTSAAMPLFRGIPGERSAELELALSSRNFIPGVSPACAGLNDLYARRVGWKPITGTVAASGAFLAVYPLRRCDPILLPPHARLCGFEGGITPERGTPVPLRFHLHNRPEGRSASDFSPGRPSTEDAGRLLIRIFLEGEDKGFCRFVLPESSLPAAAAAEKSSLNIRGISVTRDKDGVSALCSDYFYKAARALRMGRVADVCAQLPTPVLQGMRFELHKAMGSPCSIYRQCDIHAARVTALVCALGLGPQLCTSKKGNGIRQRLLPPGGRILRHTRGRKSRRYPWDTTQGAWRICTTEHAVFPGRVVFPNAEGWLVHASGLVFSLDGGDIV